MGIDDINPFYLFGALILIMYVFTTRHRLRKMQKKIADGEDASAKVLGSENEIPKGMEHFTGLDKNLQWKVVLLITLIIIGIYLVVFQSPTVNKENRPEESHIEQNDV